MNEDTIHFIQKCRASAKNVRWLVRDNSAEFGHRQLAEGSEEWKEAIDRWISGENYDKLEQVPWEKSDE